MKSVISLEFSLTIYHKLLKIKIMKNSVVIEFLREIGRKGGKTSRRRLEPEVAKDMVRLREAKRAYKRYHSQCFWSFDPEYKIRFEDIHWVGTQLMKTGDRKLWYLGAKLCR